MNTYLIAIELIRKGESMIKLDGIFRMTLVNQISQFVFKY